MKTEEMTMQIKVVGTENGEETYEVWRKWREDGRKALVVELYPTIGVGYPMVLDVSTMHLLNHANELGFGEMRIVNLYPRVFSKRPTALELEESVENLEYIKDILTCAEIGEYDIVIAWGSGLSTHACTNHIKKKIFQMIQRCGLEVQVKHIVVDGLDTQKQLGTHPLFLGLRYKDDIWKLERYPLENVLKESEEKKKTSEKENAEKGKKGTRKKEQEETEVADEK